MGVLIFGSPQPGSVRWDTSVRVWARPPPARAAGGFVVASPRRRVATNMAVPLLLALGAIPSLAAPSCPATNTVCSQVPSGAGTCCPDEFPGRGTCCNDGLTCCAHGYHCAGRSLCVAENSTAHPLAKQTPRYQLCEGPTKLLFLQDLPKDSGKRFPYYSSRLPLGSRDAEMTMATVVVHGADRNADSYYCAMHATAKLQRSFDPSTVGVFAPRFWEPQDGPAAGSLFWNGSDPNGMTHAVGSGVDPFSLLRVSVLH